mgnify:CR=1 FL=1
MASKIKVRAVKLLNTTLGDVFKDREEDEAAPAIDLPTDVATIVIPRTETPGDYEDGVYLMPTTAPEAQVLDICKRALADALSCAPQEVAIDNRTPLAEGLQVSGHYSGKAR